jgi:signal peptidase I
VVAAAWVGTLSLIVLAAAGTRFFLLEAFKVPSGSMVPTLLDQDHFFIDKTRRGFHRGGLLVFESPEHANLDFVKRVVATAGDRLEMRAGRPWINGWAVPHCEVGYGDLPPRTDAEATSESHHGEVDVEFLEGAAYLTFLENTSTGRAQEGPWTVPAGEAFVLGDNRENSYDSRRWYGGKGGGVPAANVRGEPFVVWLSVGDGGVDLGRLGLLLTAPRLPTTMASLQPALDRCLASRPPLDKTTPPRGG